MDAPRLLVWELSCTDREYTSMAAMFSPVTGTWIARNREKVRMVKILFIVRKAEKKKLRHHVWV